MKPQKLFKLSCSQIATLSLLTALAACGGGNTTTQQTTATSADTGTSQAQALSTGGQWQSLITEFEPFTVSGTQLVRFGKADHWIEKIVTNTGVCTNDFFGQDPFENVEKICEVWVKHNELTPAPQPTPAPNSPTQWRHVADEFDSFAVSGSQTVRYGNANTWIEKIVTGAGQCSNSFFGKDPLPDVVKVCEVSANVIGTPSNPTPPSATAPAASTPPLPPQPSPITTPPPTVAPSLPPAPGADLSTSAWPPQIQASTKTSDCAGPLSGSGTTLNVGPGQKYTELTQVPWLSLRAGDVVNIYHRATPYRTKFALRAQGTAAQPVIINGVTDSSCNRPEISGDGAVTADDAKAVNFWPSLQTLGLVQIYRAPNDPDNTHLPSHITLQNLKLTGAKNTHTFTGVDGAQHHYDTFSSAIYGLRVAHLTVENCEITGNNMGIFTNSRGRSPVDYSSYTVIRRNKIHLNGSGGSTEHNLYIQSYRALYEGNYIGAVAGGAGSALKDRSSASVIRYNHIVAGARAIDLVESEEEEDTLIHVRKDPLYNDAWVYGNLIVNDANQPSYSGRAIHWGFDNTPSRQRKGTLYFYNNTFINRSTQAQAYYTTVFHMNEGIAASANVQARHNVFANSGGTEFQFLAEAGKLNFVGVNLAPTGWLRGQPSIVGTIAQDGNLLTAADAQLDTQFRPLSSSLAHDHGAAGGAPIGTSGAAAGNLQVTHQYDATSGWKPRSTLGTAPDLGAFEAP